MRHAAREQLLRVSGGLDSLSQIRNAIGDFIGGEFDEVEKNRIILAVDEALTNVIMHGYRGTEGEIEISLHSDENALTIELVDFAPPFNPLAEKHEPTHTTGENERYGGLGVDAYTRIMTIRYERDARGGNKLTMIKGKSHEKDT